MSRDSRHLISAGESLPAGFQERVGDWQQRRLGAATAMRRMAIDEARLAPGDAATCLAVDPTDEAFIQVLSGSGLLDCDDQRLKLMAGDLLSIRTPAGHPRITNTGEDELVWICGIHRCGNLATR